MNKMNDTKNVIGRGRAVVCSLLVIVILTLSLFTTGCKKEDDFDYLTANLDEYVEFTESYKNLKLNIDIAKPRDLDIEVSIINMLCEDKNTTPLNDGAMKNNPVISVGDVVYIWYRGYLLSDDGEPIEVAGMSNFGDKNAYALEIGGNGFVPGFEYHLIGIDAKNYPKLDKITSGKITEDQIIYISYSRMEGTNQSTKVTEGHIRIDLSKDDVDAMLGAGMKDKLLNSNYNVGDKFNVTDVELNGKTYNYSDLTIKFATVCEVNPILVEAYFPYDYQKTELRNETGYFEVYVEGAIEYEAPEFTDEYLTEKLEDEELNLTLEELNKHEGETLVEKYRNFAKETMWELYEETYDYMVEQALWEKISELAKIKKYPTEKVDEVYEDYVDDIVTQFRNNGGQLYDQTTGQYKTHQTFDSYAKAYCGITDSKSKWEDVILKEAQNFIKERLVMFYVLRTENLVPTDAQFKEKNDKVMQEFLDEAIAQYMSYENKTRDDYTDAEYEAVIEECKDIIDTNFDDEYFAVRTYYEIMVETVIEWPEVSTLDERRAYPQDK